MEETTLTTSLSSVQVPARSPPYGAVLAKRSAHERAVVSTQAQQLLPDAIADGRVDHRIPLPPGQLIQILDCLHRPHARSPCVDSGWSTWPSKGRSSWQKKARGLCLGHGLQARARWGDARVLKAAASGGHWRGHGFSFAHY